MANLALLLDEKIELLPKAKQRLLDNFDSNEPDLMTIESMLDDDIIRSHDDGKGGMLNYMIKVRDLVLEVRKSGTKAIREAIETKYT